MTWKVQRQASRTSQDDYIGVCIMNRFAALLTMLVAAAMLILCQSCKDPPPVEQSWSEMRAIEVRVHKEIRVGMSMDEATSIINDRYNALSVEIENNGPTKSCDRMFSLNGEAIDFGFRHLLMIRVGCDRGFVKEVETNIASVGP